VETTAVGERISAIMGHAINAMRYIKNPLRQIGWRDGY
jgi:hypothetical protein